MSNCGCLFCRGESIPTTKEGWSKRKNKNGHFYGKTAKHQKHKKHRRGKLSLM